MSHVSILLVIEGIMSNLLLHLFVAILDTAALLAWPVEKLKNGIVAISQLRELEKVSQERVMLIESIDLRWISPNPESILKAKSAASNSGDLERLSDVDLDLIALTFQFDEELLNDFLSSWRSNTFLIIFFAMGAADLLPEPPCSTTTLIAYFGSFTGANATNRA